MHFIRFIVLIALLMSTSLSQAAVSDAYSKEIKSCLQNGWKHLSVKVGNTKRSLLWKRPRGKWKQGTIIALHGGGGSHHQFCSGGRVIEPQVEFAEAAVKQGFAVFLLDSTDDVVTDEKGRQCGKRFDFSVLERRNVDLPFIGKVIKRVIPQLRPSRSSKKVFMTGLSTGGYMAIRAGTHFKTAITAFAGVAAGDPYGTETSCDVDLSERKSAKGVLTDLETGKLITAKGACRSSSYSNEKPWPSSRTKSESTFKLFHHRGDAIVDLSCMEKAQSLLQQHGFRNDGAFIIDSSKRRVLNHLWQDDYNDEMLDFFKKQ